VRALLIVNPRATSTTRLRRDVIASALASAFQLDVTETRYRGHATKLASAARSKGYGLVLTLGGDGTVNEAVNGILGARHEAAQDRGSAPAERSATEGDGLSAAELPALAALPGGSANVFTGALGLPRDPIDATGQILRAVAEHRMRTIGLGMADGRYFTFNAGLGLDAEVVRAVQGLRAHGEPVTPALYVRMALRQFYRQTDRRNPALTIECDHQPPEDPVFIAIVSNTAPWTYLGTREVHANPRAGFDTGLDVFALRRMSTFSTFTAIGKMLTASDNGTLHGRSVLAYHDQQCVTMHASRPVAFQIDGEYVGEREAVTFRSVPQALRVIALAAAAVCRDLAAGTSGFTHGRGVTKCLITAKPIKADGEQDSDRTRRTDHARHVTHLTPKSVLTFALGSCA
jgi:diacylglycerol kinase family enzyme